MTTPSPIAPHLVLGTMYFGTKSDEATSFALLDRFVAAGGTTLDTANCYAFWANPTGAGGQSETTIGAWLRANPGVREGLTIATKVAQEPVRPGDFTEWEGLRPTSSPPSSSAAASVSVSTSSTCTGRTVRTVRPRWPTSSLRWARSSPTAR